MVDECIGVNENEDIRQGDVFEFTSPKSIWERYGVVITGDCDIAQQKNSDIYSYCPIIDTKTYLLTEYIPKKMGIDKIFMKLKEIIDKNMPEKSSDGIDIDTLKSWIGSQSVDECLKALSLSRSTDAIDAKEMLEFLHNFVDNDDKYEQYIQYKTILANNKKERARQKIEIGIQKEFSNYIKQLPGDLFYINYIPNINGLGYIVNLRMISSFKRENIVLGRQQHHETANLRRIARMIPPFNYRLTQKIAQMFSDIGLPEEYECDRQTSIDILFENLNGDTK